MADYQTIMRLRPELRQFIRNRRWVNRGEAVVYGPNIRCAAFSTDAGGFRHSTFAGRTLSVRDCLKQDRYGIVLGSSHVYGFGLAGNENTIPSLLAERFGFPFANVCMPEANSRNLHSLLAGFIAPASRQPSIVVHLSGGDFTSFCFTAIADPVFGSPNLKQMKSALEERAARPNADEEVAALFAFSALWTRSIAALCRSRAIPLVLGNDTSFFEKSEPSASDVECELGTPANPAQHRQFANHRRHYPEFCERRAALAQALGVPLAGPGMRNDFGFIDEFHYDRAGTRAFADQLASAVEGLL